MRKALFTTGATVLLAAASVPAVVAQDMSADDIIAALPEDLASLYVNYPGEVVPAQLPQMSGDDGPWKMCHSESFQGNPWRRTLERDRAPSKRVHRGWRALRVEAI